MSLSQATDCAAGCPATVDPLRRQAHDRLDELLDWALAPQRGSYLDFEKDLLRGLLGLGLILVQLFLLARQQRLDLTPWLRKGYRIADDCATRTLKSIFGPLEYGRVYLLPPKGQKGGVHPLDV